MKQNNIQHKLKKAFENATPDVLSSVFSDCGEQKGTVIPMTKQKRHIPWRKFAAMAAALALVVGLGLGFGAYRQANAITSTISLDVNPSIELKLNRNEKVKEVVAHNADGEKILAGMDLKNSDLNVAVNALIGSMLRNGYLNDVANSILVSVNSNDPVHSTLLQQQVTQAVNDLLNRDSFSGAVLSQSVSSNDQIKDLAQQHNISVGKAQLINRILSQNSRYTFAELAALSIHELNLLSTSRGHHVEGVDTCGTASEKGYIGADAAKTAALAHCGLTEAEVSRMEVDIDCENGVMIYEVDFDADGWEYEYDIDAKTGAVLHTDKESNAYKEEISLPNDSGKPGTQNLISREEATNIALVHAAVNANAVRELECELDRDDGKVIYAISFEHGHVEYEYDIDASTGAIISWEKDCDKENGNHQNGHQHGNQQNSETKPNQHQHIGKAAAKALALEKAGLQDADIREYECELETENGNHIYEISFEAGTDEYEFEIDAVTGEILNWHTEKDD